MIKIHYKILIIRAKEFLLVKIYPASVVYAVIASFGVRKLKEE